MMDLAMNFDADECLVTAMFDKGNRNDTMEAIDHIIPFLKGDADMIGLVCNTIRKLFCIEMCAIYFCHRLMRKSLKLWQYFYFPFL